MTERHITKSIVVLLEINPELTAFRHFQSDDVPVLIPMAPDLTLPSNK